MTDQHPDVPSAEAAAAELEWTLIADFVRARGYDPDKLADLPEPERRLLLKDASVHASAKLTEIESRAHFVHSIHAAAAGGAQE